MLLETVEVSELVLAVLLVVAWGFELVVLLVVLLVVVWVFEMVDVTVVL